MRNIRDIRTLLFLLGFCCLRAVQAFGWVQVPPGIWVLLFTFLMMVHLSIAHNHIHLSIFKSPALERATDYLLTFLTVDPIANLRCLHVYNHHRHCDNDQDLMNSRLVPAHQRRLIFLLHPVAAFFTIARNKAVVWADYPQLRRQKQWELAFVYGSLAALAVWQGLASVLLYWVLPSLISRWWLALINLIQHDGCDPNARYEFARNFTHPMFNWLFFNAGYHTAHHLRPRLHWSKLPHWHQQYLAPHIPPHLIQSDAFSSIFSLYILGNNQKSQTINS